MPLSSLQNTRTVGFPRESRISMADSNAILVFIALLSFRLFLHLNGFHGLQLSELFFEFRHQSLQVRVHGVHALCNQLK
jgi:hypothetical protein